MRKRLEFLIAGGAVRRFHALEVNRPPTDAEHSWGVALLCALLLNGHPSEALLMAALTHDMAEHETGDMPSHVKRVGTIGDQLAVLETEHRRAADYEYSAALTAFEAAVLNFADQLEGMLYCVRERRMGNTNVCKAYERWAEWVTEQPEIPNLRELFNAIQEMWEDVNGKH